MKSGYTVQNEHQITIFMSQEMQKSKQTQAEDYN